MLVVIWIIFLVSVASGNINPTSKTFSGQFKTIYHEKSKQKFTEKDLSSNSLFGFSITYQEKLNSLIVGSPKASLFGEVYRCPIQTNVAKCDKIPVEKGSLKPLENFWFGATVNAGKSFSMACAPRFIKTVNDFLGTRGACYYLDDLALDISNRKMLQMSQVTDYLRYDYHRNVYGKNSNISREQLSDSFGWSSFVNQEGLIFVGGPAMSVGRVELYLNHKATPELIEVNNDRLKIKGIEVSFNFGYGITTGFFATKSQEVLAVSTPYGNIGLGRVYFYNCDSSTNFEPIINTWIENEEIATLFGASLCSLRYRELSALLVGAPGFDLGGNSRRNYDTGAVYVYTFSMKYTEDEEILQPHLVRKLFGYKNAGYFGAAIVSIGDFNGDKIDEAAISAPFEHDYRGAVYIYSGAQLLENETSQINWLQRILPEDGPNQYFGLALHAPSDADKNGCQELAIGAPGRNYVNLLRCMASVEVGFKIDFPDLKSVIRQLTSTSASFNVNICLLVVYKELPNPATIETDVSYTIQLIHPNVKMHGANKNGVKFFMKNLRSKSNNNELCEKVLVELPKEADYDRDIVFNLTVSLVENPVDSEVYNSRSVLLNNAVSYSETYVAPPLPGSELTFDLQISMKEGYLIGSTENETITLSVHNDGKTAYRPCVRVRFNDVPLSRWPLHTCFKSDSELRCTKTSLPNGHTWTETVHIAAKELTSDNKKMEISAELWTSDCTKPTNKTCRSCKVITLATTNNFSVSGYSSPNSLNLTNEELSSVKGKQIDHIYNVINLGVTTWKNVICEVTLPHLKTTVFTESENAKYEECVKNATTGKAVCVLKVVKRNIPAQITVRMEIQSDSSIKVEILKGHVTLNTSMVVTLRENDVRQAKVETHLFLRESPGVPLWMILIASLVGLLIVIIICWILDQYGFLNRKNKEKLEELKQEVKRQSMRRSMMIRQSTIEVMKKEPSQFTEETQQLIKIQELEEEQDKPVDPARAAFELELAKALSKNPKKVTTHADVHQD